ncbi:hypothetical protein, partial [Streptomyces boncukensis]
PYGAQYGTTAYDAPHGPGDGHGTQYHAPYGDAGQQGGAAYGGAPYGASYGAAPAPAAPQHPQHPQHAQPGPFPPQRDAGWPGAAESPGAPAYPHGGARQTAAPPDATMSLGTVRPDGASPRAAASPAQQRPAAAAPTRTGSPIIAPGMLPAALTAALGALLAGAASLDGTAGRGALAVCVVLLQAVTAAGWFRLNGMWPARQGIALAFLGGVAADAGLLIADGNSAPTVLLGTLGVWCVLSLVLHLRNRSSPDERLYALTAGFASIGFTVLAAGHLAAEREAVTVGLGCAAVATLARAVPLPPYVSPAVALLAAAGAGVALGRTADLGAGAALLGLAAGGCALIGLRVASYDFPSRFVHMTAGVALPLTLAVPAVYFLGRALT